MCFLVLHIHTLVPQWHLPTHSSNVSTHQYDANTHRDFSTTQQYYATFPPINKYGLGFGNLFPRLSGVAHYMSE